VDEISIPATDSQSKPTHRLAGGGLVWPHRLDPVVDQDLSGLMLDPRHRVRWSRFAAARPLTMAPMGG
jgi:hypothetical protein